MQIKTNGGAKRGHAKTAYVLAAGALAVTCATAFAAGPYAYVASNFQDTVSVVDLSNTHATPGLFSNLLEDPSQGNPGFWASH